MDRDDHYVIISADTHAGGSHQQVEEQGGSLRAPVFHEIGAGVRLREPVDGRHIHAEVERRQVAHEGGQR